MCIFTCFFNCIACTNPCCNKAELCTPLAAAEGTVYKQLINQTAGVYGDLCTQNFGPVFQDMATSVVQSSQISCEYDIPLSPDMQTLDPAKVNVQYTPGGGSPTSILNVPDANGCGTKGGWYYDNPASPTKHHHLPEHVHHAAGGQERQGGCAVRVPDGDQAAGVMNRADPGAASCIDHARIDERREQITADTSQAAGGPSVSKRGREPAGNRGGGTMRKLFVSGAVALALDEHRLWPRGADDTRDAGGAARDPNGERAVLFDDGLRKMAQHDRARDWNEAACKETVALLVAAVGPRAGTATYDAALVKQRCGKDERRRCCTGLVEQRSVRSMRRAALALHEAAEPGSSIMRSRSCGGRWSMARFTNVEAMVALAALQMKRDGHTAGRGRRRRSRSGEEEPAPRARDRRWVHAGANQLAILHLARAEA